MRIGNEDPTTLVVLGCAAFSGVAIRDRFINTEHLEEVLNQIDGITFIETIEDICQLMLEKHYHYMELEQDLNVIFKETICRSSAIAVSSSIVPRKRSTMKYWPHAFLSSAITVLKQRTAY